MDSESQALMILSQVEIHTTELEQMVQRFEHAAVEAEQQIDAAEQLLQSDETALNDASLQDLTQSLQVCRDTQNEARIAHVAWQGVIAQAEEVLQDWLTSDDDNLEPLPNGKLVCGEQYRLLQLLYTRPRVHLYLAQRLGATPGARTGEKPLVVIRELVLNGLDADLRQRIIRAAFEEFVAPRLFGSPHFVGVGDHVYVENGRHYLVMQPRQSKSSSPTFAVTLAEFLSDPHAGADELEISTVLKWGIELCGALTRLHHMKNVLGEIAPEILLVDREGNADWTPLLLAGWPPAPPFWAGDEELVRKLYTQTFPAIAAGATMEKSSSYAFVAPEVFMEQSDERSDVYSLGAILYLLFTRRTPMDAAHRIQSEQSGRATRSQRNISRRKASQRRNQNTEQEFSLIVPRQLNDRISPLLEQILLRALALHPDQRFASPRDLAQALEGMMLKTDTLPPVLPQARVSRLRRLLLWMKKER